MIVHTFDSKYKGNLYMVMEHFNKYIKYYGVCYIGCRENVTSLK